MQAGTAGEPMPKASLLENAACAPQERTLNEGVTGRGLAWLERAWFGIMELSNSALVAPNQGTISITRCSKRTHGTAAPAPQDIAVHN